MNEQTLVEKKRNSPPRGAGGAKKLRRFTAAEKLKAMQALIDKLAAQMESQKSSNADQVSPEDWATD